MSRGRVREWAERLLREPDNLFGPPTGRGYDYHGAALTVAALALGTLSAACLLAVDQAADRPVLAGLLLLVAAPYCIGMWFGWPVGLVVGWAVAAVVWYATLHTITWMAGWPRGGRVARYGRAGMAVAGWVAGIGCAAALWLRPA